MAVRVSVAFMVDRRYIQHVGQSTFILRLLSLTRYPTTCNVSPHVYVQERVTMPRPTGTPTTRPDKKTGIYYIHWTKGGRSNRRSTGTRDKAQADKALARFILGETHTKIDNESGTVRNILDVYDRGHVRKKVRSRKTYAHCEQNLLAHFGDMQAADITVSDVEAYEKKRANGIVGKPSKGSTIRRELAVLVAAMNYAKKTRQVEIDELPYIPLPDHGQVKDRWLTKDEFRLICSACPVNEPETGRASRAFRAVKIMVNTAARRGAVETLKWEQVDFEHEVIHFNPSGRKQTKKRRASVPINTDLMTVLERAYDEKISDYVLDTPDPVYKEIKAACVAVGLDEVTPHTFRHTYGTWAAQRGVSLVKIAGVMGDTIETTYKHYLHHCPDELRDAV